MDSRPEWRKRMDRARVLAWLARGKAAAGPEHPDSKWIGAIEAWHTDGDKGRLIALVDECVQPSPEMTAVACAAVADALRGNRMSARNSMPPALRRTLEWRAARSWWIKREIKPTWKSPARGFGLDQEVAKRVNNEWRKGGVPWRVPFGDKNNATARTVADDAREVARNLRQ